MARAAALLLESEDDQDDLAADAVTPAEQILRQACADIFGLSTDQVSMARSFLNHGGDSITAMQLSSRYRAKGLKASVQDILHSHTLSQLAMRVGTIGQSKIPRDEPFDQPFVLSPIQQLYFTLNNNSPGTTRFNQSFFLRLTRPTEALEMARAVEALVSQNSMLRARFHPDDSGQWWQTVTADVRESFAFTVYETSQKYAEARMVSAISNTQSRINPMMGPLFAVDLFNIKADAESEVDGVAPGQVVFLIAHHLVVDLVSWRVLLQQLEELLETRELSTERPVPFRVWNDLQRQHIESQPTPEDALPFTLVPSHVEFWGLQGQNTWRDVESAGFSLGEDVTRRILGDCNRAFDTEPVDIFITALVHSFRSIFTERGVPTIFSEGHGREPWDTDIDISNTVGWFTIMRPVAVPVNEQDDIIQTLWRIKDARHATPSNGWVYFASRFLHPDGPTLFGAGDAAEMEIIFNYLGRFQQLESKDTLLKQEPRVGGGGFETADMGPDTPRMGLIDVSASVHEGHTSSLNFAYSKKIRHASRILDWVRKCEETLLELSEVLPSQSRELTLSDVPLLALTQADLWQLTHTRLPGIGVQSLDHVEDIYPCSSIQHGMLVSQAKAFGHYESEFSFEAISRDGVTDFERLGKAWQAVVDRHAILRTIFIDGATPDGVFAQVDARIILPKPEEGVKEDRLVEDVRGLGPCPDHRFIIEKTADGRVECRLKINHALIDGATMPILFRDLAQAYGDSLPSGHGPLYRDYIAYLSASPREATESYWAERLSGLAPCHFPRLIEPLERETNLHKFDFELSDHLTAEIQTFFASRDVTISNLIHTAWAILLRIYTGSEDVFFGYLTSGRDVPVRDVEDTAGPFINMLTARLAVPPNTTVSTLVAASKESHMQSLGHQNCSLTQLQHALGLAAGQALFNTAVSLQTQFISSVEDREEEPALAFRGTGSHDPTEYDITLNVSVQAGTISGNIKYWTSNMVQSQAAGLVDAFITILRSAVAHPDREIASLEKMGARDKMLVNAWNQTLPKRADRCVHDIISEGAISSPSADAVCSWDGSLTYAQLDSLSTRHARLLVVEHGVGPETSVLICLERSLWTPVSLLAVLKAGGAFVPLDPKLPKQRIHEISLRARATVCLADKTTKSQVSSSVRTVLELSDQLLGPMLPTDNTLPTTNITPDNAAYIIFTSGSTGVPKGVVIEHSTVSSSTLAHAQKLDIRSDSRVFHFASLAFDASITEILSTLIQGGCVCIPSEAQRLTAQLLA